MKTKKSIIGSVAVDSETGLEHYQTPKAKAVNEKIQEIQKSDSKDTLRKEFHTPNYGESGKEGQSRNLAGVSDEFLHLFEHDSSEVILLQATRHPIGVFAIFSMAGTATILIITVYLFLISDAALLSSAGISGSAVGAVGGVVVIILLSLIAAVSLVGAHVYKKSRLILTNQKVVLIQYHSLISREVSQLNIGEVEDVNVSQLTLIDRIFKTGKITIETSGEQNNYMLTQVEKPYEFARKTIQMHEGSIAEYGN